MAFAIKKKSNIPTKETHSKMQESVIDSNKTSFPIRDRSRLSCDISAANHRLLKVHAAKNGKSILEVVEELIEHHCKGGE